jgi:tRNA pseudouridine38-40 synthase
VPTYRLTIAYDGSRFHGYARQPEVRTVQGELEEALVQRVGPVETSVAGRTDKGVHATGQVVAVVTSIPVELERLVLSLNRRLGPEISVLAAKAVPEGFSARFDATGRAYEYRILNRTAPDPFLAATTWHVAAPLDVERMNVAATAFVGERDFASLCRKAGQRSTVRDVRRAEWRRVGDVLIFDVSASSFCHQMVRSMVAVCVDVGRGKVAPDAVPAILAAADRHAGRGVAPPHGLTLVHVEFP